MFGEQSAGVRGLNTGFYFNAKIQLGAIDKTLLRFD